MKSVKKDRVPTEPEIEYPCLMEAENDSDLVVLFESEKKGTVMHPSHYHHLNEIRDDWVMESFRPFNGTIELSND